MNEDHSEAYRNNKYRCSMNTSVCPTPRLSNTPFLVALSCCFLVCSLQCCELNPGRCEPEANALPLSSIPSPVTLCSNSTTSPCQVTVSLLQWRIDSVYFWIPHWFFVSGLFCSVQVFVSFICIVRYSWRLFPLIRIFENALKIFFKSLVQWCMPLISALKRQSQLCLLEFKANLV